MEVIMQEHDPEAPLTEQIKLLWTNYFRDALGAPVRNHFIRQYEYSDLLDEESQNMHLANSDIPNQLLQSKKHIAKNAPYRIFRFPALQK
jgi:hypothetical protein